MEERRRPDDPRRALPRSLRLLEKAEHQRLDEKWIFLAAQPRKSDVLWSPPVPARRMVQDVVLSDYALDIFTDRPKGRGIVSSALENDDIRFEKTHFVQEQLGL